MSLLFKIAWRYLGSRRDNAFVSFIAFASAFGIMLGVAVLVVVMSVMSGFEHGIRDRVLSMVAHITVTESNMSLSNWQRVKTMVEEQNNIASVTPFVERQAMIINEDQQVLATLVHAINPDEHVQHPINQKIIGIGDGFMSLHAETAQSNDAAEESDLPDDLAFVDDALPDADDSAEAALDYKTDKLIVGQLIADKLNLKVGSLVTLMLPRDGENDLTEQPIMHEFEVVGVFHIGMEQYDRGQVYTTIDSMSRIYDLQDKVTALQVQVNDLGLLQDTLYRLYENLPADSYFINDWRHLFSNFFQAIQLQKNMLFIIIAMIIITAAFYLISSMVMTVTEKRADIGIYRTLGLPSRSIMIVFMLQGIIIGALGTALGLLLGVVISMNIGDIVTLLQNQFGIELVNAELYGIAELRGVIEWPDVAMVITLAMVLSTLATIYPALRAATTPPAEVLRYE